MEAPNTPEPELPELSEENFERLSPEACRVFAFRAAIRVTPLIGGTEGGLAFWPVDDRWRHVLAVAAAIDVVLLLINNRVAYADAARAAADAARAAADAADAARAAADAARAAADAARAAADAADAARAAADAADAAARAAMQWDLEQLLLLHGEIDQSAEFPRPVIATSTELLSFPLWQQSDGGSELAEDWSAIIERWQSTMAEAGMDDAVRRYMDLVDGKPWDIDETERRFNKWYEEYGKDAEQKAKNVKGGDIPDAAAAQEALNSEAQEAKRDTIHLGRNPGPDSDQPTGEDSLGRLPLVKALTAVIDHSEYKGRATIGLLGHWGAGKSSVLGMLTDALSKPSNNTAFSVSKNDHLCATFNAWAYEHTDNIQAGMAQEVVNGLTKGLNWKERLDLALRYACKSRPASLLWILLAVPVVLMATIVAFTTGDEWQSAIFGASGIALLLLLGQQVRGVISHPFAEKLQTYLRLPSFGKHLGELPVIQQQVDDLCELVLFPEGRDDGEPVKAQDWWGRLQAKVINRKGKEKRLLFMVDDLDRCGVDGVIKTLEAVRLVMDLPNVTTIVAIDHRMALAALSVHYHDLAEKGSSRTAQAIARDYLGKIFNLPIQLDRPGGRDLEGFIDKVLFKNVVDEPIPSGAEKEDSSGVPDPSKGDSGVEPLAGDKGPLPLNTKNDEGVDITQTDKPEVPVDPSSIVEETTDDEMDLAEVEDVIKDTRFERDHFFKLSRELRVTNPRQLKRLHNSYRLLKALEFHRNGRQTEVDQLEYIKLMTMVFWLEYISCMSAGMRQASKEALMRWVMPAQEDLDQEKLTRDESTYSLIGTGLGWKEADEQEYRLLEARVQSFMLPYAEVVNNDSATKIEKIKQVVK